MRIDFNLFRSFAIAVAVALLATAAVNQSTISVATLAEAQAKPDQGRPDFALVRADQTVTISRGDRDALVPISYAAAGSDRHNPQSMTPVNLRKAVYAAPPGGAGADSAPKRWRS